MNNLQDLTNCGICNHSITYMIYVNKKTKKNLPINYEESIDQYNKITDMN